MSQNEEFNEADSLVASTSERAREWLVKKKILYEQIEKTLRLYNGYKVGPTKFCTLARGDYEGNICFLFQGTQEQFAIVDKFINE